MNIPFGQNNIHIVLARWLTDLWYKDPFFAVWLKPFSMIFHYSVRLRRFLYRIGLLKSHTLAVPVIVVGNITVGGTGKTPFIIWLAEFLKQSGLHPGIISRGYGGSAEDWPQRVQNDSDPKLVGDEALLLAQRGLCPVAVGPSRIAAGNMLLADTGCDVILSDDGMQHYALQRDIEIAVIDGTRRFGNGAILPGGPLREPISRLQEVDIVVCNGGEAEENEYAMQLQVAKAVNLVTGEQRDLQQFKNQLCHAVAGIGNPSRFFATLEQYGLQCDSAIFPDHYAYRQQDIEFKDEKPVLMTEKDAVKCIGFAGPKHWYVPVQAVVQQELKQRLQQLLEKITTGNC